MLDIRGVDFFDKTGMNLVKQEVDAIGGIEGERDEILTRAEFEVFEYFATGGLDFIVSGSSPFILDAFTAGIVLRVVIIECVNNWLRSQTLAGGIEIDVLGGEIFKTLH